VKAVYTDYSLSKGQGFTVGLRVGEGHLPHEPTHTK
jgi:hypothetical protein